MAKRVITLVALVAIMGLSLLAIHCEPGKQTKMPAKGLQCIHEQTKMPAKMPINKRLQGIHEQFKVPLKGFY